MVVLLLVVFEESPVCLSQWLHQIAFPPAAYEGSPFSTPSPAFLVCGSPLSYCLLSSSRLLTVSFSEACAKLSVDELGQNGAWSREQAPWRGKMPPLKNEVLVSP